MSCDIDLDDGVERCPQCLRKSTVRDPDARGDVGGFDASTRAPARRSGAFTTSSIVTAVGLALAIVGVKLATGQIRTGPQIPKIPLPAGPSDPFNAVLVRNEGGGTAIYADGADFQASLVLLRRECLTRSGVTQLWLPTRFDDAPHRDDAAREETTLNATLGVVGRPSVKVGFRDP